MNEWMNDEGDDYLLAPLKSQPYDAIDIGLLSLLFFVLLLVLLLFFTPP